ncbi:hypothetical protein SAMN05444166_7153 [Singulisphaera sp. GP187]|uniref:hypothetical protein n=1 Tax=Singulisphaera sp. GP187 TaxID=1882752 RepID=UPI00092950EC|nr:hypothetical protein [Singulisphaera sp. GP187]SIO62798.1 hypothetical protein SAMN05444166_7153 [Singulisphaera sp. GP187]
MRRAALPFVALLLALMPVVRAADVTIESTFPADRGPGYRKPAPDAAGAVGQRHAVALDDRAFVAVDKATGQVVKDLSQHDFWLGVQSVNTLDLQANDPRILYDPLSGHWIAWVQGIDPMNGYLAVSTTSDPTGPWKGVKFPIPPHNYGAKAGLDKNGFYLTLHNGNNDTHKAHTCYAIPKADLIAPNGPDLSHLQAFPNLEIESFPATDLNPDKSPDAPEVLLNKEFGNAAGKLYLYKIKWSGTKASISDVQTIPLSTTYSTPNASVEEGRAVQPAPGGKLRADEPRRTDCVFAHGGSVFGCNGAKRTLKSRPGILWYELRVSDGALLQEGLVDDPTCDYLNPSLAVDRDGNVGLGCTRTSEKEFPSVYVMMHAAGDPAGSMGAPVLAVPGTTHYRINAPSRFGIGWGNYSTTCVDPSDPTLLWTCQEYANSTVDRQWCTAWVAFRRKVNP